MVFQDGGSFVSPPRRDPTGLEHIIWHLGEELGIIIVYLIIIIIIILDYSLALAASPAPWGFLLE